jgi:predicted dehydrogenase
MTDSSGSSTRRDFLKRAGIATAAVSMSASSYARVVGANERILIGVIGCGDRGLRAHMPAIKHGADQNVEIVAVADPWRVRQEMASAQVNEWYGRSPRQFASYRGLLAMTEVNAVTIASPDHVHTTHLHAAAEAGKDVYCEKPLSLDLPSLRNACDAVRRNNVVFQAGTQLRSYASFTGAREVYRSGVLGTVGRIEQCRNADRPYWYAYIKDVNEADVDWDEFLGDTEKRPFDPVVYSGWYGYRPYSEGPIPGLASHFIDLVHYITGATFPSSVVAQGGTFTWKDEHNFTAPDHTQALWTYPDGFMVSYSTNFGNGSGNSFKIFGDEAVLDLVEWEKPKLTVDGINNQKPTKAEAGPVAPIERPDHFQDWLQCIRTRETCNAGIDAGYQHAVATIMAMTAFDRGKRMVYDVEKREIVEG